MVWTIQQITESRKFFWRSCHGQTDNQPDDIAEWQVESLFAAAKNAACFQKQQDSKEMGAERTTSSCAESSALSGQWRV